jgi:hypothetical protein
MLPEADEAYLRGKGWSFEVSVEAGMLCVVIQDYVLPLGFDRASTDLLVRLPGSWPDGTPDMFWVDPEIRRKADGAYPEAAASFETYLGRKWQRFSRHVQSGAWRPSDGLGVWMAVIAEELAKCVR